MTLAPRPESGRGGTADRPLYAVPGAVAAVRPPPGGGSSPVAGCSICRNRYNAWVSRLVDDLRIPNVLVERTRACLLIRIRRKLASWDGHPLELAVEETVPGQRVHELGARELAGVLRSPFLTPGGTGKVCRTGDGRSSR